MRAIDGWNRLFQRNLAGLVEDDDIEQTRIERQRVRDAERAHEPDRFQILNDLAGFVRGQVADGFVAHRLSELVLQVAPPGSIGFLEHLLFLTELRGRQRRYVDVF